MSPLNHGIVDSKRWRKCNTNQSKKYANTVNSKM